MATDTTIDEEYDDVILQSTNNYPLCNLSNTCGVSDGEDNTITIGDGTVVHTILVSFENIRQNMVSYPYTTDISDDNYYVRTYSLPENKKIIMTTDMRTEDIIITTLHGDTPNGIKLVKTTNMSNPKDINVEYT